MGACFDTAQDAELKLTAAINSEITNDKLAIQSIKKILFLGSGGSGKSTIFKQLRRIHGPGYNDRDRIAYTKYIHQQIINEMKLAIQVYVAYNTRIAQKEKQKQQIATKDLLNLCPDLNQECDEEKEIEEIDELAIWDAITLTSAPLANLAAAKLILEYEYSGNLETKIACAIKALWSEPCVKEIYALRSITKIETSSSYFWNKLDQIADINYIPSSQDILLCRRKTTGLHEQKFKIRGVGEIHIIDVGGQQSERRKWIHCFEHVVAVIFIASLSCYDETLCDDLSENSMTDQLRLFETICNDPLLKDVAMILFLNKTDLFEQKYGVEKIPLNKCQSFYDFEDETWNVKKAKAYVMQEFQRLDAMQAKKLFTHLTRATDENNIERVFADVQEIIIDDSLTQAALK